MREFEAKTNSTQSFGDCTRIDTHRGIGIMVVVMFITTCMYIVAFAIEDDSFVDFVNRYLPFALILTSAYVVYKRLQHNILFIWSPEIWFYIYSAIQFGLGSLIYFYGSEDAIRHVDHAYYVRGLLLLKTNILNSVTILIITLVFLLFPKYYYLNNPPPLSASFAREIKKMCFIFLLLSFPLVIILNIKYIAIPGFFTTTQSFTSAALIILFFLWSRGDKKIAKWAVMLLIIMNILTMASFGKTIFLQTFLFALLGIFMGNKKFNLKYVIFSGLTLIILLSWYKPISDAGRAEAMHLKPFSTRLDFTANYILGSRFLNPSESDTFDGLWSRQNLNSIQGFLIERYDQGYSGNSFKDIWIYFIPRSLWPDKPITTNVARDLNELVFGYTSSALAPSFNGDAYWNGGWVMVVIVSLYIGTLFSLMSRLSLKYIGKLDLRYMPIAIMSIELGRYTEGFFASSFIGGVALMIAWWLILKKIFPKLNINVDLKEKRSKAPLGLYKYRGKP